MFQSKLCVIVWVSVCHFSLPVFVCSPVLFLCTPVTHLLITACVFKSVFSLHSPLLCLFDNTLLVCFSREFGYLLLDYSQMRYWEPTPENSPTGNTSPISGECLWLWRGTVHSGCCSFSSSWGKMQYHSPFFSVFSGHVAANFKKYLQLSTA